MQTKRKDPKVVVVGAGFGRMQTAQSLSRSGADVSRLGVSILFQTGVD